MTLSASPTRTEAVPPMIELREVNAGYGSVGVLSGCSARIERGEFVCIQGESGSGKTTLLKVLYRDIDQFGGEIRMDGHLTNHLPRYQVRRMVGTIFQSFELLERKTALENVALAGEVMGRPAAEVHRNSIATLARVGLAGKESRLPRQLSGGEQQRVAVARALLNRPKILVADEPTGNLDERNARNVMEILRDLQQRDGLTVLVISHSGDLVRTFGSRVLTISGGKLWAA